MNRLFYIVCLIIIILPYSLKTHAQVQQDTSIAVTDPFQNWLTTSHYMKNKGLDPVGINWLRIEPMCLGLKTESDLRPYNKCKYEKARDSVLHDSDRKQCFIRAKAAYPDRLTRQSRTEALRETGKDGAIHDFERIVEAISKNELESLRYSAVIECMQSLGWANADNWRMGKRCDN